MDEKTDNLPVEDALPPAQNEDSHPVVLDELERLREENRKLTDQLLRKQAEMENARKRLAREKEEFMQYSLASAVQSLLPVLDGFELALESEGGGEEYRKGIRLIHQQLLTALERLGLEPLESVGQQFDPHLHEAVATVESQDVPDNQVVGEMQRGYFFKKRLLRPARVRVAHNVSSRPSNPDFQPE